MDKNVQVGDKVKVNYIGAFTDGKIFDTSHEDVAKKAGIFDSGRWYEPLAVTAGAGELIKGFDNALIGMTVGEKKQVTIPPEMAYGKSGDHPLAGKTLVFNIELVSIN